MSYPTSMSRGYRKNSLSSFPLSILTLSKSRRSCVRLMGQAEDSAIEPYSITCLSSPDGAGIAEMDSLGDTFDVLFLGTGVSSALPSLTHIVSQECEHCIEAACNPDSKNKRNNVSIALLFEGEVNSKTGERETRCVVVDFGKTAREACITHFPRHGIKDISSIILTHGHADAIFGLDDVRLIQKYDTVGKGFKVKGGPLQIFLHQETMDVISRTFGYLTQSIDYMDEEEQIMARKVSALEFKVVGVEEEFEAKGMPVKAFPVYHGKPYISLGFSFGREGEFVYISDVSEIPEDSMKYLKSIPKIKVLVSVGLILT